ncbi:MAG: flagellar biosynthetic protein FliO [Defluviitaleaceae bacterium]|nr:flagellar biosynthetic protein FliO [Defluviitaleaceae bacterium]
MILSSVLTTLAQGVTIVSTAPALLAQIWNMVVLIVAFAAVVALAYFSLRLMGRAKNSRGFGGNIKVIEAAGLGFQNTVQLIKAGNKYFLIGVSRTGITMIGEVDEESLNFSKPTTPQVPFENVLSKFFNKEKAEKEDE